MWAQNWQTLLPILIGSAPSGDAGGALRSRNLTVVDMARMAQQFFVSMGFDPLPDRFWAQSQFVQPSDGRDAACHASAVNFFREDDVRFVLRLT